MSRIAARLIPTIAACLVGPLVALALYAAPASAGVASGSSAAQAASRWTGLAPFIANAKKERSNEVEVEAPIETFTIVKEQKIAGESNYTTEELKAKVGETIDYKITVTNTGEAELSFEALSDPRCTNITPAGATKLAFGESESFTCEHTLSRVDFESNNAIYENVAVIEGNEKEQSSPPVKVKVELEAFEIVKEQKLAGEATYTTHTLTAEVGKTVDYRITVTNTGSLKLAFGALGDPKCTGIEPAGATELEAGKSETFTCEHALVAADKPEYTNAATLEGNKVLEESNKVVVAVAEAKQVIKPACAISESSIELRGASGSKRKPFTIHVEALGIKEITFYLDGRKIKTLRASQAKHGEFTLTVKPGKLSYGAHRIKLTTVMTDIACAAVARTATFVHPKAAKIVPKFTG